MPPFCYVPKYVSKPTKPAAFSGTVENVLARDHVSYAALLLAINVFRAYLASTCLNIWLNITTVR